MHRLATTLAAASVLLLAGTNTARPDEALLPPTKNAALRYWMAFAHMENPPEDEAVSQLLERTAAGLEPWNERRLGPILDRNREAIEMMQRASALPECSWGIEYELGPDAAISHLARGRALARLNVLHGLRLESRGDMGGAIGSWLRGLRFALDLGRDGTLVAALVSRSSLSAHLAPLIRVVGEGKADAHLDEVDAAVRRIPSYGLDWSATVRREASGLDAWFAKLQRLSPEQALQEMARMGVPVERLGTEAALRKALETMRAEHSALENDVAAAYGLSYSAARERLAEADARLTRLSEPTQQIVFRPSRPNESRAVTECDRAALLTLVALRRHRVQTGGDAESLEGLDVPEDPYTGKRFALVRAAGRLELRSGPPGSGGAPLVYALRR